MLDLKELGKLSENDVNTLHDLNVLNGICIKHNDVFTNEERAVLGKCIGMYIGTFESEMIQELLVAMVTDIFCDQIKKGES